MGKKPKIKCKYCSYEVPIWMTTKNGYRRSGWWRIAEHIKLQHPEHTKEADAILGDERSDNI